jgi:hypothetical protein
LFFFGFFRTNYVIVIVVVSFRPRVLVGDHAKKTEKRRQTSVSIAEKERKTSSVLRADQLFLQRKPGAGDG